jgi:hypothetical protein
MTMRGGGAGAVCDGVVDGDGEVCIGGEVRTRMG